MIHPDIHTLTGAYALDALDDEERVAFEAHLPDCDACREEVAGFLSTATTLGAAATADAPPPELRAAVLAAVATTRQDPPAPDASAAVVTPLQLSRTAARRAWLDRLLLPAAAVMVVVVVGMSLMIGDLNRRIASLTSTQDHAVAAVVAAADLQTWEAVMGDGSVRVVYSAARGQGWFLGEGIHAAGDGMAYELWLIDEHGPAPAGVFDAHHGRVVHGFTGDVSRVAAIGVTIEPATGSPQPTSDPIVVIEVDDGQG